MRCGASSQPAAGATALRVRVSQLRKALGPGGARLVTRAPGYALLVESGELDLQRFERALDRAAAALPDDPAAAAEHANVALSLWRGAPLADIAYSSYAQAAIARLEELRAAALELRIEAELALGHHAQVVGELQQLVAEHPLRERMWGQLMLALYRDGRQADALAAYRAARRRLVDEVGIEPGPGLRALESAILAQDPSLAPGAQAAQPAPQRAVLALMDPHAPEAAAVALGERLARRNGHELIALALVSDPDDLGAAAEPVERAACSGDRRARRRLHERRSRRGRRAPRGRAGGVGAARRPAGGAPARRRPRRGARDDSRERGVRRRARGRRVARVGAAAGSGARSVRRAHARLVRGRDRRLALRRSAAAPGRRARTTWQGREPDPRECLARAAADVGIAPEPELVDPGEEALLTAAAGASAIVAGLSERWTREGIGAVRLALARRAPCPVLLVRSGLRPGGLAPAHAMTSFTWSGAR